MFYENLLEVFCANFDLFFGFAISGFPGRWGRFQVVLLWVSFCFLQVNQKNIGIVSTNNV